VPFDVTMPTTPGDRLPSANRPGTVTCMSIAPRISAAQGRAVGAQCQTVDVA
jgi:hypothetical protein